MMHQQAAYVPPPPIPVTSFPQTSLVHQQPPQQPQQPQQPQPTPAPPLKTPYGIEPQDVPWLADLIARQAVRLFDSRLLQDLTPGVAIGHHYALHTAQAQIQVYSPGAPPTTTTCLAALKQYHRPADMIMELHQLLTTPASPYTNPLLGVVQLGDQNLTCLMVPFHPLGNLRQYIADHRAKLSALQQMQIIHDIASGLEFLHQRGIHHMNLHTANVLVSMDGMAILTDFGRPNVRAEVGQPPKPTVELERVRSLATVFMAPEVLASGAYSSLSEVYALGMVMFELLTGHVAFERELGNPGLSTRIMFGRQDAIPPNITSSPGPAYEALILNCWKLKPRERPHLSELKHQLEQLMAECRRKNELARLEQQQQQQILEHNTNNTNNTPLSPTANAPPALYTPNFITTTQVIVTDSVRSGSVSTLNSSPQDGLLSTGSGGSANGENTSSSTKKPVEAWTIGQATAPTVTQQRDALPVTSRALEISSGQLKNKSMSGTEHLFTATMSSTNVPPVLAVPVVQTSMTSQTQSSAVAVTGTSTVDQGSNKGNIPSSPTPSGSSSTSSVAFSTSAWPLPPVRASSSSQGTTTNGPPVSHSTVSETKPSPIHIPARSTSYAPATSTPRNNSLPKPVVSPDSLLSPDSLFNPGRNTMIIADAIEKQQKEEPMPTHFNWRKMPRIPGEMSQSVASSVQIVGNGNGREVHHGTTSKTVAAQNGNQDQQQRRENIKSYVATIEQADPDYHHPVPVPQRHQQPTENVNMSANSSTSSMANNGRSTRESFLVIPAFPEPPSTLHNRRISNIDVRYRSNARQNMPRLQEDRGHNSFSSDDSLPNGRPTSRVVPAAMPQEALSGAPATGGLTTRGAYTPITSSEDVPAATQSTDIYSAARNGDLEELQHFLHNTLHRSLSDGSSNSNGGNNRVHPSSRRSQASVADILDEYEPIERLPVLCCAAVARKNKYQALNMVLKAGANVEGREQRAGNTPLHLVCETADPPIMSVAQIRHRKDEDGNSMRVESVIDLLEDPKMSQLSILDLNEANGEDQEEDNINDDDTEEGQEEALKRVDELDEQEQQALNRVKEDSDSIFSLRTNEDGQGINDSSFIRQRASTISGINGSYYRMKNQILLKGGLEDQIRLLVLAGSPLDTPNSRGETPLLMLLRYHDYVSALATLLRLGADPTTMAPFGPGLNPTEIQLDPKSVLSPFAQKKLGKKLFSSRQNPLLVQQQLQQQSGEDPNHILVMHGSALAHAAYYLRVECVKYLLEHEVECSDPILVEQAIIACQHSVAAQVNPSLVELQDKIVLLLERNWRGEEGRRRRYRVAERVLNRKKKPIRSNPLLVALAVSVDECPTPPLDTGTSSLAKEMAPRLKISTGRLSGYASGKISASLGAIPTTHLYATDGPTGQEIQLISHHGFQGATSPTSPLSPSSGLMDRFQQQYWSGDELERGEHPGETGRKNAGVGIGVGRPGEKRKDLFRKVRNIRRR